MPGLSRPMTCLFPDHADIPATFDNDLLYLLQIVAINAKPHTLHQVFFTDRRLLHVLLIAYSVGIKRYFGPFDQLADPFAADAEPSQQAVDEYKGYTAKGGRQEGAGSDYHPAK